MTIHAKSLNALVSALERDSYPNAAPPDVSTMPPASGALAVALAEIVAISEALASRCSVGKEDKPQPRPLDGASRHTESPWIAEAPSPLYRFDGSLGLRQPAERREAIHKAEAGIPLFSGFISREELSGR